MKTRASRPLNLWGSRKDMNFLRKPFELAGRPAKAFLRIFVDTGYELYLNGRFVAAVDEWNNTRDYEVSTFLKDGGNVAAVKTLNHGGHRGFAFELLTTLPDGLKSTLVSDGSWKSSPEERWGWKELGFDDSKWESARVLDLSQSGDAQWRGRPGDGSCVIIPTLACSVFFNGQLPKGVDSPFYSMTKCEEIPAGEAVEILGEEYVSSMKASPAESLKPVAVMDADAGNGTLENVEGVLGKGAPLKARAPKRFEGPSFIVDFGEEAVGLLRLKCRSAANVHLRLLYGETRAECHNMPSRDMLLRRMISEEVEIPSGLQEWESSARQGFRFVRVEFEDCQEPVEIEACALRSSLYRTAYKGFFSCSDAKLDAIWASGRKTLHLCMQEFYLDGVKRDRFLWVGDTWIHALANYYLFGDVELFKYSWRKMAETQYSDGAIPSVYGEGQPVLWDYVGWWLIALDDFRLHAGEIEFLSEMRKPMLKAVSWLLAKAGPDGLIDVPASRTENWFVVLNQAVGKDPLMNWILLKSLEGVSHILDALGDSRGAAKYAKLAAKTAKALGEFAMTKEQSGGRSIDGLLLLASLVEAGRVDEALSAIRELWGYMLDTGCDTQFEGLGYDFGLKVSEKREWKRYNTGSHCHAWSAGPSFFLPAAVLGVRPLEPAFKSFEFKPSLGSLRFAKGAVPTPFGTIAAKISKDGAGFSGALFVPESCVAKLALPLPQDGALLRVDGPALDYERVDGRACFELGGGRHSFNLA